MFTAIVDGQSSTHLVLKLDREIQLQHIGRWCETLVSSTRRPLDQTIHGYVERRGIFCNCCKDYNHIGDECRAKRREQQKQQPMVSIITHPTITRDVTIPTNDYNEFLHFKATITIIFFCY